jgi:flagellin
LVSALNANSDFHGNVTASDTSTTGTSKLTLTGGAGVTLSSAIKFYPAAAAGVSSISNGSYQSHTASTLYGTVTLRSDAKPIIVNLSNPSGTTGSAVTVGTKDQSGNPVTQTAGRMSFQVGPAANQLITIDLQDFGKNGSITGMVTADVDSMEPSVNIRSVADANQVIDKIASAMDNVNAARSTMGAVMNRLEHVIDNLNTVSMNAEASRSQIEDADYAKASTELARTQIMQQAATAVLAQANTSQQTVLKLLQG